MEWNPSTRLECKRLLQGTACAISSSVAEDPPSTMAIPSMRLPVRFHDHRNWCAYRPNFDWHMFVVNSASMLVTFLRVYMWESIVRQDSSNALANTGDSASTYVQHSSLNLLKTSRKKSRKLMSRMPGPFPSFREVSDQFEDRQVIYVLPPHNYCTHSKSSCFQLRK